MRLGFPIVPVLLALSFLFPSCRLISSFLHDGKVVAKVGQNVLYESEVAQLIPDGTPQEDSIRLVMQYADTWAMDMIFLEMAETHLSKTEKDVTRELEAYRRSLLKYRYEQLYINERLDTAVTDAEVEEYYRAHTEDFKLSAPIVKARYMKVYQDSPDIAVLKKKMSSPMADDVWEADSLAWSSAVRFTDYADRWVDISVVAKDMDMDYASLFNTKAGAFVQTSDKSGKLNIVFVSEKINEGNIPPVEYCEDVIIDRILSTRKHRLVSDLEQDLLEDARTKGKFIIY